MKQLNIFLLFGLGLTVSVVPVQAQQSLNESLARTQGLSGGVQLLVGGYRTEGLNGVSDDNRRIESLDAKTKSHSEDFALPLARFEYGLANGNTALHFGVPENGVLESEILLEMGVSHDLANGTRLSASYIPEVSELHQELWQDPFLTGRNRKRTDASVEAFRLAAEYVFGSPLTIRYDHGKQYVENDRAGQSLVNRLTASQIRDLQRDSDFGRTRLLLTLPLTENFLLIPGIDYIDVDAEGRANSYTASGFELTVFYRMERLEFFGFFYAADSDYEKINPVFNRQRDDDSHSFTVGFSYLRPFDLQGVSFDFLISEARQNSNIRFYEADTQALSLGVGYRF